jgi:2-amino-4-hydroxy-6-hydroxymethyldihydropteridine diphosphokinase
MLEMADVYVGLGSNLGDPTANLRAAVERLARCLTIVDLSSAYWTEPVGLREQPRFLNAVARARTTRSPREVLDVLVAIEVEMGRQRDVPLGPRIIDLDLLLYDGIVCEEVGLSLPHPRMLERRFVLEPLAEIAPALEPPHGRGARVVELLATLPEGPAVERASIPDWPPPI